MPIQFWTMRGVGLLAPFHQISDDLRRNCVLPYNVHPIQGIALDLGAATLVGRISLHRYQTASIVEKLVHWAYVALGIALLEHLARVARLQHPVAAVERVPRLASQG